MSEAHHELEDFRFFVPCEVVLEKGAKDKGKPAPRTIKGYASTDHVDADEEKVVQEGLDLSYFRDRGYFNYDHNRADVLGWPTVAKIDKKGFYTEGQLVDEGLVAMADKMWTTAVALAKSGAPRKLGLSIEGKVLERSNGVIRKARVYNVAITPHPINPYATFEAMTKSMLPCACEGDECTRDDMLRSLDRSLAAGYATDVQGQTGGGALRKESLDPKIKVTALPPSKELCEMLKGEAKELCLRISAQKTVSREDALTLLQITSGKSRTAAKRMLAGLQKRAA